MDYLLRFAIMGAGNIARKFCDAVERTEGCCICAVGSKSLARAQSFADAHGIPAAYGSYETLLETERPDCVYIATTCDAHYVLSMLCLEHRVPVLCEKAMFTGGAEAKTFFEESERRDIFSMEALWSLFLPAIRTAREWVADGRIGEPVFADFGIGFIAPSELGNRYFNPALGGGAANDLSIYGFHILPYVTGREIESAAIEAVAAPTGVDATELVLLKMSGGLPAVVKSSLTTRVEERMVIYGTRGKLVVPNPHFASEALLYDAAGVEAERFEDVTTENGFIYEIEEVIRCIRSGAIESPMVPHASTLAYARLLDRVRAALC